MTTRTRWPGGSARGPRRSRGGRTLLGDPLGQPELLRLAGRRSRQRAALLGGFTISARTEDGGVDAVRFFHRAIIPELRLSTEAEPYSLPDTVPPADAVANIGACRARRRRTGERPVRGPQQLTVDRLHQTARRSTRSPGADRGRARGRAIGACLSGRALDFDDLDAAGQVRVGGGREERGLDPGDARPSNR